MSHPTTCPHPPQHDGKRVHPRPLILTPGMSAQGQQLEVGFTGKNGQPGTNSPASNIHLDGLRGCFGGGPTSHGGVCGKRGKVEAYAPLMEEQQCPCPGRLPFRGRRTHGQCDLVCIACRARCFEGRTTSTGCQVCNLCPALRATAAVPSIPAYPVCC